MSNAMVSICMPAYNAGKYIAEAINSVLSQSYERLELIVVNDGSTDNTAEILHQVRDKRVKIFHQSNKGQSSAANTAFELSSGSLIKFMDADDIISLSFIENQVKCISGRKDAIVSASWGRFYNNDLSTFKLNPETVWKNMESTDWLTESWRYGNSMMQCALWLIPRQILDKSGLWDKDLNLINDFDFFSRVILNSSEVLFEKEAILFYRSGISGSLSDSKSETAIRSAFKSIEKATRSLLSYREDKDTLLACANTWQQFAYTLYPKHKNLLKAVEYKICELGGSDIGFKAGKLGDLFIKIFNWKTFLLIQSIIKN
ncbi:MAG: glycosyltransferase family 2 protein [Pedobacter sp.]|nr:MAG: glycosyltransferase family 2 protein [Pedobacter sp.]